MPSNKIFNLSQLYIEQKDSLRTSPLIALSAASLDPVEYGMGFHRGELNEFVGSNANSMTLQEDLAMAFNEWKWTLAPEKEHLEYLVELWWDNLHSCSPDQRKRYIPLEKGLRVSKSGRIFYPYDLYRSESFPIYTIDGTLAESGITRVWSSIPPYIWLVAAAIFVKKRRYRDVSERLCPQKWRLDFVDEMVRSPIPHVFFSSQPQPLRPLPYIKQVEESQSQAVSKCTDPILC